VSVNADEDNVTAETTTTSDAPAKSRSPQKKSCKRKRDDQSPARAEGFLLRQQEYTEMISMQLQRIADEEKRRNDLIARFLESQQ